MAHYYLVPYVGTGRTIVDPFRPEGIEGASGSIDLRPDCSVVDGFALLSREIREDGPTREYLGDTLGERNNGVRTRLGNRLGVTLDSAGVRDMVAELLIAHGDPAGRTRWKPLQPAGDVYEIFLGDRIYTQPVLRGGSSYSESFNKANAGTLGPDLTWTEVAGTTWAVVSNQANCSTSGNDGHARAEHATETSDQFAQVTVVSISLPLGVGGPSVRYASAADTHYNWQAVLHTPNEHGWAKWVTGTETYPIGTADATDVANGSVLRGSAIGSTLRGYKDGVLLKTVTDTAITGNTRAGLRGIQVTATFTVDNFSFGDLSINAASGAYALTGTAAQLEADRIIVAGGGAYALTGMDAGLQATLIFAADAGSYALTGTAADLLADRILTAAAGSYALTGTAAGLQATLIFDADGGAYVLTGSDATLTLTPVAAGATQSTFFHHHHAQGNH